MARGRLSLFRKGAVRFARIWCKTDMQNSARRKKTISQLLTLRTARRPAFAVNALNQDKLVAIHLWAAHYENFARE